MSVASKTRLLLRTLCPGVRAYPAERLVFLHVHKCGGNSLRNALREAYGRSLPGGRRRCFHVSPARSRQTAARAKRPVEDLRDDLLRYHLHNDAVRLATGHFHWPEGLREEFPGVCFVNVLREPVSQFLSNYYYERARHPDPGERERLADLERFLESDRAREIGSRYVRVFGGPVAVHDTQRPEVIQRAADRLASVEVVGVLEDLPAFVEAFRRRFGVRLSIAHANRGRLRRRLERSEVTEAIRERIAERVRPNRALYDLALERVGR